jgi:hypothetical protein
LKLLGICNCESMIETKNENWFLKQQIQLKKKWKLKRFNINGSPQLKNYN